MEHKVNSSYGVQKAECERLRTRLSDYFIWSEVLFGELLR